jgi:hypothetical protein
MWRLHVLALAVAGVLLSSCGSGADDLSLQDAEDFRAFPLYYVGDSFQGLPLTAVIRGSGRSPIRSWTFIYGSCEAKSDQGCAPPLEIQNESICTRYPAIFGKRAPELAPFRGARVARGSAELYTGRTTLVIYGQEKLHALAALRPVGVSEATSGRFPPPTHRALEGRLPCQPSAP